MTLKELGYNEALDDYRKENQLDSFSIGRIISEHKERYIVNDGSHEWEGEIIGNLRYTAKNRSDFPAVGDWVAISPYDEDKVLIHSILPRATIIERQAVGKSGESQIIATNIDYGFIVVAVDRDFNINRIERYLTICNHSRVAPIVVLTKIDLIEEDLLTGLVDMVKERIHNAPVLAISNQNQDGYVELKKHIKNGKTYCLLGSSGWENRL